MNICIYVQNNHFYNRHNCFSFGNFRAKQLYSFPREADGLGNEYNREVTNHFHLLGFQLIAGINMSD